MIYRSRVARRSGGARRRDEPSSEFLNRARQALSAVKTCVAGADIETQAALGPARAPRRSGRGSPVHGSGLAASRTTAGLVSTWDPPVGIARPRRRQQGHGRTPVSKDPPDMRPRLCALKVAHMRSCSPAQLTRSVTTLVSAMGLMAATVTLAITPAWAAGTDTFSETGSMQTGRFLATSSVLPDGRALVAGGIPGAGFTPATRSAGLYDPQQGVFAETGDMTTGRHSATATVLDDGTVLVAGGQTFFALPVLGTAELYDADQGTFTETGPMATPRYNHTATKLQDGKVLILGGTDGFPLASAELYDPQTGEFTDTGPLNTARQSQTASLLQDGRVLVAGGMALNEEGNQAPTAAAEIYDPVLGVFTETGSMTSARTSATAAALPDGRILLAGGGADEFLTPTATAETFDSAKGSFESTGSMTHARIYQTSTALENGRVLVAGGLGETEPRASAELYDPLVAGFVESGPMTSARTRHTASLLNDGQVLVAGGLGQSDVLATADLFHPTTAPGAPEDVSAVADDGSATLSWQAPSDNGGLPITNYLATSVPGGLTCTTSGETACEVYGLANGTPYAFTVRATNEVGTGPASKPSGAITPATTPGPPTSVRGIPADSEVAVTWQVPSDNGGAPIVAYTVSSQSAPEVGSKRLATATMGNSCSTSGATTCTITGLENGQAYTFTVSARNVVGTGPESAASAPVIPVVNRPGKTQLRVKALKKAKKLEPTSRSKIVRSAWTDGRIKWAKTHCYLNGNKLRGDNAVAVCRIKTKQSRGNVRAWVKPKCSVGLKVKTVIVAKAVGQDRTRWHRTWTVKSKPRTICALNGNG